MDELDPDDNDLVLSRWDGNEASINSEMELCGPKPECKEFFLAPPVVSSDPATLALNFEPDEPVALELDEPLALDFEDEPVASERELTACAPELDEPATTCSLRGNLEPEPEAEPDALKGI